MNEKTKAKLIAHRVRKGANAVQSAALLEDLIARHEGWNLHYALCYQGFAGERGAEKAVFGEGRDAFIADAKATAARAGLTIPERAAYVAARVAHFDASRKD